MRRILFFFFTISLMQLSAQTLTLTGQYKDKKSNPIENAKAVYWYQGAAIDSVYTDSEGMFVLTVDKTFLEEASDYIINQVHLAAIPLVEFESSFLQRRPKHF